MADLTVRPVEPHPWRFHRWDDLDITVGVFGIARQCRRCHIVEVTFPIEDRAVLVPPSWLTAVGVGDGRG